MFCPFLSVITPLYNKELYISETIQSVLAQSFQDWEMIVVENGSSDNGPEIVRSISDPRIRLVVSEKKGPSVARNRGISESFGEWIQFLDADDLLLSGHLQKMFDAIQANPGCTLVSCDWLEGREFNLETNTRKYPTNKNSEKDFASSAIAFTPWVPHSAWVKKELLGEYPWWDEDFDTLLTAEDHVFWFKMLLHAKAAYSPHLGVFYRVDAKDRRHNLSDFGKYLRVVDFAIQKNLELLKQHNVKFNYQHGKMLMNCYLEQSLTDCEDADLEKQILRRIAEFRPSVLEAIRRRDAATIASHFLPPKVLARIQKRRRGASSSSRS
jgi:glycosyltransferase involved in cell wall biosynthesis